MHASTRQEIALSHYQLKSELESDARWLEHRDIRRTVRLLAPTAADCPALRWLIAFSWRVRMMALRLSCALSASRRGRPVFGAGLRNLLQRVICMQGSKAFPALATP
jgi:hypothetical protein